MDVIILQDGIYHLYPVTKSWFIGVTLLDTLDLFSPCDVLRDELTTYLSDANKYVMYDGCGYFFGSIQN